MANCGKQSEQWYVTCFFAYTWTNDQPVMLREPSFKPPVSEDGEVGASDDDEDDDEESEPEVEGAEHGDSEDETETERAQGKGKGKKKGCTSTTALDRKGQAKDRFVPWTWYCSSL